MRLDSHQHFWKRDRGDYRWLTPDLVPLYRDFLPPDLEEQLQACKIDGTVLVQAAETMAETEFMLDLAARYDFIKAVVGWVDFESASVLDDLRRLSTHEKCKAVRPMIQWIDDIEWMLRPEFDRIYRLMEALGLRFEALIYPRHLDNLILLLNRYPTLPAVLDHAAKPAIAAGEFSGWAEALSRLARQTRCCCKISGLWTEAGGKIDNRTIGPYVDHLLAAFGPERLMWGSDWPVLTMAGAYEDWFTQSRLLCASLNQADQHAIFGGTAAVFYGM